MSVRPNRSPLNTFALLALILLFLLSSLAHADHVAEHSVNAEQECYICHQDIDTSAAASATQVHSAASYHLTLQHAKKLASKPHYFVLPQLRAPPLFQ